MCLVFTPISQGIARSGMEHSAVCPTIPCATSQPVRGRTSCSLKEAAQFEKPRIDFALHLSKDQVVISRQKKNRRSHEVPILYLYRSSRGFFLFLSEGARRSLLDHCEHMFQNVVDVLALAPSGFAIHFVRRMFDQIA